MNAERQNEPVLPNMQSWNDVLNAISSLPPKEGRRIFELIDLFVTRMSNTRNDKTASTEAPFYTYLHLAKQVGASFGDAGLNVIMKIFNAHLGIDEEVHIKTAERWEMPDEDVYSNLANIIAEMKSRIDKLK